MATRKQRAPIHLAPGGGRPYRMGPVRAVFKADGAETRGRYAISEWWLEPRTRGAGAHHHPDDDVFFVIEGTMTIMVGERWIEARQGSFVLAPGGVRHDFENRTTKRAGMLNVSVPGDFEPHMPGIADWFRKRSKEDARSEPPRRRRPGRSPAAKRAP